MNTSNRAQVAPQIQSQTNTNPIIVTCYCVVIDQTQPDGTRLLQRPVSPNFRTREAAEAFLAECQVPGAYGVTNSYFFRKEDKAREFESLLFSGQ